MMLFQHGTYEIKPNGTLLLNAYAFEDDGRQLISDPCKGERASYYRYNQNETFKVGWSFFVLYISLLQLWTDQCSTEVRGLTR